MTGGWKCSQCNRLVSECSGNCGKGTSSGRPSRDKPQPPPKKK